MNGWGEDPNAGGKQVFFDNNDKQNKQKLHRRGKTDWQTGQGKARQGRAGQGRTQDIDDTTYGNRPTRNYKIIKGANEEGNEGKQLGKINQ